MAEILIIEDEGGLRDSLLEGLSGAFPDSTFEAFCSVEDALEPIRVEQPQLVITDIRLPGQSGVDFLLIAKRRWPAIRFVLITAYANLMTHKQAEEYGAYRLLKKPFALQDLVDTVKKALGTDFSGNVEGITILELMQIANLGRKDLTIYIRQGASKGTIYFRAGEVVHAETGDQEGIEAFNRIVRWQRGDFETRSGELSPKVSVRQSFQALVLEALQIIDEEGKRRTEIELGSQAPEAATEDSAVREDWLDKAPAVQARLNRLGEMAGFLGICLAETGSGRILGLGGKEGINIEVAAAGNAAVVQAEKEVLGALAIEDHLGNILITLKRQYHLLSIVGSRHDLFLYLILDRSDANLAQALQELEHLSADLDLG